MKNQQTYSGMAMENILEKQKLDVNLGMKIGDRVRVKTSVVVYHNPEHRGKAFELEGSEGEVINVVTTWKDRPVSANLPVLVKFSKKFKAHLRENELEILSEGL